MGTNSRGLVSARAVSFSAVHTTEFLSEIWNQRVEVGIFDRDLQCAVTVLTTASLGLADASPVGGAVAGTPEARSVDEGLDEVDGMAVLKPPVGAQSSQSSCQEVASEMRDLDPGQGRHIMLTLQSL